MKKYIVAPTHEIYVDDYEQGQGEHVNTWGDNIEIEANTPMEAIKKYFKTVLFYSFEEDSAIVRHREFPEESKNVLSYSHCVDVENSEATPEQIKEFSKGKLKLYICDTYIEIYEVTPAEL